ncbi:pyridoxamine 5'-phosphate oxidase family protein [Microbacterium sp. BH-3-3-3]|uniref:pyridoxamine 5'-phosphate oxidase family protein n=1 Tax=Microbacterium sp. BH-3-3-3 TaxID=1906742 RepID=UPI0016433DAF|nr:pyridoxamine 5'-phosphate oxidase family protein [Microbacterium sp. BH-3-3-3]
MPSPEQRAAAILAAHRYVVLGTADADGPWTAAAQYRLLPRGMFVESDLESRHARAIAVSGSASGVVFDSSAALSDADGVQLAFRAREVDADETTVREVLGARLARDATTGSALEGEVAGIIAIPRKRLYVLHVERAYVFDRDAWRSRGTDARLEVDVAAVWAGLAVEG